MVSTRKKKTNRKAIKQLNETLINFITGINTIMGVSENENLEQQASGCYRDSERIIDNASQNQVTGNTTDDGIRKAVISAVVVVKNRMYDGKLTETIVVVIPGVETAVISVVNSSKNGHISVF